MRHFRLSLLFGVICGFNTNIEAVTANSDKKPIATALVNEKKISAEKEVEKQRDSCSSQVNSFSTYNLCANTAQISCMQTDYISAGDICAATLSTPLVLADNVQTPVLCANTGGISNLCSNHVQADELCALKAVINQLCVRQLAIENALLNQATICNLKQCSPYNVRVAQEAASTVYTLGDILTFDTVITDPLGSVSQFPTAYTVPVPGMYAVTVQIQVIDLVSGTTIAGSPIGSLELYVNGLLKRKTDAAFLDFNTGIDLSHTTVIHLKAGDIVTNVFQVFVINPLTGLTPVVGQVTVLGNPSEAVFRPIFLVQYLSSDCTALDCLSSVCDDMGISCLDTPCVINCSARDECSPCMPICFSCCS